MNNIFQSLSRQFSFSISYFVGLVEFLTYVIPIMINNLYIFIFIYVLFKWLLLNLLLSSLIYRTNVTKNSSFKYF
ncbi:hypothetical protein H8356DRAFT_1637777 [Neocallimastix lanati (nom. inval.)]|nr:hypothetical protein H8356DRAFT_1637777 [Neocallimastix sp. JGI-2020a]